jgi:hypothetical protein
MSSCHSRSPAARQRGRSAPGESVIGHSPPSGPRSLSCAEQPVVVRDWTNKPHMAFAGLIALARQTAEVAIRKEKRSCDPELFFHPEGPRRTDIARNDGNGIAEKYAKSQIFDFDTFNF